MSARVAARRWWLAVRLMTVAAIWSLGLLLAGVLVPAYDGSTVSADGVTLIRQTLVQNRGAWVLAVIAAPALASAVVAVAVTRRRRDDVAWGPAVAWTAIAVLVVVALLGITTLGAFMLPVAVVLAVSVRLAPGWGDVRAEPTRPRERAAAAEDGHPGELATGA